MISKDIEGQLALAGICQAAALVQSLARRGHVDEHAFEASISSILVTSPDNPQQVYGALNNLSFGFKTLLAQLDADGKQKDAELTRYIASIISLERKLSRQPNAMKQLAERISHVQRQTEHLDFEHQQTISSLASIYVDVVSPLAAKIQVAGDSSVLGIESNQHKVRALLLAGIRSAVLWRQMGGKRRHILWQRKNILRAARQALRVIN